jgi:hypothetical protein
MYKSILQAPVSWPVYLCLYNNKTYLFVLSYTHYVKEEEEEKEEDKKEEEKEKQE